jgi:hypothetical protein
MTDDHSDVRAHRGFFPIVKGDRVSVTQAGGSVFLSNTDLTVNQGGAHLMLTRGDATIHQGGANALGARGSVSITQGGAFFTAARAVTASRSYLGVVLAPSVEISDDSRVLLGPVPAIALGVAMGTTLAVLGRLMRRP